jgi:hypothetical protein
MMTTIRNGAALTLDPERREEQLKFVRPRADVVSDFGDQVWVNITPEQAEIFREQGIEVQLHEQAYLIEQPAILFDPLEGEPRPPADFAATEPGAGESAYYLVQFIAPPDPAWLAALEEAGGVYVEDLAQLAVLFSMTAEQAANAREQSFVRWVGLHHPIYALDYRLAGRETPFSAADLSSAQLDVTKFQQEGKVPLQLKVFSDLTTEDIAAKIEAAGASVETDTGYSLVIYADENQVLTLLRLAGVSALEPYIEAKIHNQRAGILIGANQVRNLGKIDFLVNLDGEDEIVGVLDTGLDNGAIPTAHPDFNVGHTNVSRVISIGNINAAGITKADHEPHGTHVVGSIAGNGSAAETAATPSLPRGIAPRARIIFHSVNLNPAPATPPPAAAKFDRYLKGFKEAYAAGARVQNNSWGNQNGNRYSRNNSEIVDAFAFTHPDTLVLFSAGNDEDDLNGNGVFDMNTLGEYAVAKNILCIGACENETDQDGISKTYRAYWNQYLHKKFDAFANPPKLFSLSDSADDIALFSNRGRVIEPGAPGKGRVRPDLVAPGTNVMSTRPPKTNALATPFTAGDPLLAKTAPSDFYFLDSGTSMATPIASGACLLVRQFYRTRFSRLRRPLLIEAVPTIPPPAPPLSFVDIPSATSHALGYVLAWVRPVAAPRRNDIVAARFNAQLVRLGDVKVLASGVGDHPALAVAQHDDTTLLVSRATDGKLNLALFDKGLDPVKTFGTAGVVATASASRPEDDRRPTLCVKGDEVGVAWVKKDADDLLFQRFRADTGAALDANPQILGLCTNTSLHPYLVQTGTRYAAVWVRFDNNKYELLFRTVSKDGKVEGAKPVALVAAQPLEIREAHLAWDARNKQYLVAWIGVDAGGLQSIYVLRVREADGAAIGSPLAVVTLEANQTVRRPRIELHPSKGCVMLWEDNTQGGKHDVYLTFLDGSAKPDPSRIPSNRLQISDTPNDTSGFSAFVDADGVLPVWQSDDEINSDLLGVFALRVTGEGAFQAQVDPNTPLLQNNRYVPHQLNEHGNVALSPIALAWTGGEAWMLRLAPVNANVQLELVRTNADGQPLEVDDRHLLHVAAAYSACALYWTGQQMVAACSTDLASHVFLLDGNGKEEQTFGPFGRLELAEPPAPGIFIQVAQMGEKKDSRLYALYGKRNTPAPHNLRYTVMDSEGQTTKAGTIAPLNLANGDGTAILAEGTARHSWFHLVKTHTPVHFIAAWHLRVPDANGKRSVQLNRFRLDGKPQAGVPNPMSLTGMVGDSLNAVIAPRPVLFDLTPPTPAAAARKSRLREYGAAWQFRADDKAAWEIRFSRLDQTAKPHKTIKDVPVLVKAGEHATHPQLIWHTDGYGLAWLQQSATDGANQYLCFTVLDENGARVSLPPSGTNVPWPVSDFQVSSDEADVKSFQLVWNGRTFRMTWTEVAAGKLRQRQMGLVVPRLPGGSPFDEPFQQPSAALVRATLINGATNIRNTSLPNLGTDPNDGYGWGRINLRQSLAPVAPVTFYVRDDSAVEKGRTARYKFRLPPNTNLLRVTLAWTDPPRRTIINNLNLRVTAPAAAQGASQVYVGNRWQTAPPLVVNKTPISGPSFSNPLPANLDPKIDPFDKTYNVEQVVIANPGAGDYLVEVMGGAFLESMFMQQAGQPFALVFVGSGPEIRTAHNLIPAKPGVPTPIY